MFIYPRGNLNLADFSCCAASLCVNSYQKAEQSVKEDFNLFLKKKCVLYILFYILSSGKTLHEQSGLS